MPRTKVLIVDDEPDILELVEYNLDKNGYDVECLSSGEEALDAARAEAPDLMILDLMLPGIDGLEVCRQLKTDPRTRTFPILMLTAKGEEADIVTGLELGADDYVVKPFSPRVLVARVKSVLRRRATTGPRNGNETTTGPEATSVVRIEGLTIHPGRREVLVDGQPVELTFTEFGILQFLARRPGWVFTRGQIVEAVQGQGVAVTDRSVDVHIVALRRKLGAYGDYVETVRGVGYRFKDL